MTHLGSYKRNRLEARPARIVLLLREEDLEAIDEFGGAAGYQSRNAAIRGLLRKGLEAAGSMPAQVVDPA